MALSDREIFKLWEEREQIRERIEKLKKMQVRRDTKIIAELQSRGTRSLTQRRTGRRITMIQNETTEYIEPSLRRRLSRSPRGRAVIKRCERTILDMKAVAGEVLAGNIPTEIVKASSKINKSAAYLKGSGGSER